MTRTRRALLSVADKTGVIDLAKSLINLDIELLSTGGTAAALRAEGLAVTDVSTVTGFPEIMDGRVKTLHPKIHGGLLSRGDVDADVMHEHAIDPIDFVFINLYPFEATVAKPDCSRAEAIENIDIGGPAMIRAAAKNHRYVTIVVDPQDYSMVLAELGSNAETISTETSRRLATKAFGLSASYDAAIWTYLNKEMENGELPLNYPLGLHKQLDLRYGENPHQRAALYKYGNAEPGTLLSAVQHQGKELSYNNLVDADAALECVKALPTDACVIVKHANPCGVGVATDAGQAYEKAYATDPSSAFGGIIAFNVAVDGALAKEIVARQFVEVIVASEFTVEALDAFSSKKNLRVLETGASTSTRPGLRIQQIEGAMLVQDKDTAPLDKSAVKVVTQRAPTEHELSDALLAWQLGRFVKSNAIVCCKDGATLGVGAGQMSRVMSAQIAAWKAAEAELDLTGAAMASDAFFPFRDGIDIAAKYGIGVVIQPGGSMRDDEVIAAADEHDIAMIFTGMRHFRH